MAIFRLSVLKDDDSPKRRRRAKRKFIHAKMGFDNFYKNNFIPWVVKSNHPRFARGTRFDYGFLQVALEQGYKVTITPASRKDIAALKAQVAND